MNALSREILDEPTKGDGRHRQHTFTEGLICVRLCARYIERHMNKFIIVFNFMSS